MWFYRKFLKNKQTIKKTEGPIKNGQSRETGNIRQRKTKQKTRKYILDITIRKQAQIR